MFRLYCLLSRGHHYSWTQNLEEWIEETAFHLTKVAQMTNVQLCNDRISAHISLSLSALKCNHIPVFSHIKFLLWSLSKEIQTFIPLLNLKCKLDGQLKAEDQAFLTALHSDPCPIDCVQRSRRDEEFCSFLVQHTQSLDVTRKGKESKKTKGERRWLNIEEAN